MSDAENLDGIAEVVKSLQSFHIAFLGGDKAGQAMQEIEGSVAVDGANVGTGLIGPGDLL